MTHVIVWKELREQAAVVIALAVLGVGILTATAVLGPGRDTSGQMGFTALVQPGPLGVMMLTMTAGVVVGGSLFAGEREARTFVFLDQLPGSRVAVWWRKVLAGVGLVAGCTTVFFVAGASLGTFGPPGVWPLWAVGLATLAGTAFGWGAAGSAHGRTTLAACGLGLLYAITFVGVVGIGLLVMLTGFEATIGFRQVFGRTAYALGLSRGDEAGVGPIYWVLLLLGLIGLPLPLSARWYSAPDRDRGRTPAEAPPAGVRSPRPSVNLVARPERFRATRRLFWLARRQHGLALAILAAVALSLGASLFLNGVSPMMIWPGLGVVIGVLTAVATWADEQSTEASRFWGERRLPVGKLWWAKLAVGSGLTVGLTLLMLLPLVVAEATTSRREPPEWADLIVAARGEFPLFKFVLVGPLYGFAFGHLATLVFRKGIVAGAVGLMVAGTLAALWIPSLFSGGLHGWQVWTPPILALATARVLAWAWATNAIGTRRAVTRLAGGFAAAVVALAGGIGFRVAEVRPAPAALAEADVQLAKDLPTFDDTQAGREVRRAVSLFTDASGVTVAPLRGWPGEGPAGRDGFWAELAAVPDAGYPAGRPDFDAWFEKLFDTPWEKPLAEAAAKPTGVLEDPNEMSFDYRSRTLPWLPRLVQVDLARGLQLQALGGPAEFLPRFERTLAVVRTARNKGPAPAVEAAARLEAMAYQALDAWLGKLDGRPDLLKRALAAVRAHAAAPFDPADNFLGYQVVARKALDAPSQWLPRYLSYAGTLDTDTDAEADFVGLLWAFPWEKERLRRLVGRGNDPSYSVNTGASADDFLARWDLARGMVGGEVVTNRAAFQGMDKIRHAARVALTERRAAEMRLAVRLYQHDNAGRLPASAEALVPKYLPAVPADPFADPFGQASGFVRPLGYRLSGGERIMRAEDAIYDAGLGRGAVPTGVGVAVTNLVGELTPGTLLELARLWPNELTAWYAELAAAAEWLALAADPPPGQSVAPGQAIVWSVGPDIVDTGGRTHLSDPISGGYRSGDLVYPVPLPPAGPKP